MLRDEYCVNYLIHFLIDRLLYPQKLMPQMALQLALLVDTVSPEWGVQTALLSYCHKQ